MKQGDSSFASFDAEAKEERNRSAMALKTVLKIKN